ncbi:MAG: hypothetical protein ABSA72_10040, partial [Nitrososphaerales archaeon]
MKARETIVLALVLSLALAPVLMLAPVSAQSQYTERVDVYTAGSNAYWTMTLNQLNSTIPNLSSAEGTAGLSSYRLLAMTTQSSTSDFQVFGVDGYNLLKVPSMPAQGLFLTVNASSSSSASPLVSLFASRFATVFTLVSSTSGTYVYFAPVDFTSVAAPVLFRLVPTTMKGFASFVTETTFIGLPMASIALTGTNSGSGFTHTITFGGAASGAVSSSAISIPTILSDATGNLTASPSASSSQVVIHSLDGVIQSTDQATVVNVLSSLSGTYTLNVSPGKVAHVNATITSQAPTAIAYRSFDRGTLAINQSLAVTIYVKDTASTGSIQNVTVDDNWWQAYPSVFALASGTSSFTIPVIAAGQNMNETYVLKVLSTSSQTVTVPSAKATYAYLLSSTSHTSEASLNQAVLQINNVGPAVTVTARSTLASGVPLGTAGNYSLTLTNSGNSPALNVKVGGTVIQSLSQGSSQTVSIPISLTNLARTNFTKTFPVEFTNSAQQTQNVTSNSVSLLMSHSSMILPFIEVSTNDTLTAASLASKQVDVTYSYANKGTATSGALAGTEALPSGVTCTVIKGNSSGSCSGGTYTMHVTDLTPQNTQLNTLQLSIATDNYVIQPAVVAITFEGATLHSFGGAYIIPAGIVITKTLGLSLGFPGMTTSVTLGITDEGTGQVFNATLGSTQDSFDTVQSGAVSDTYATLAPGQSQSFNYTVALSSAASGNISASPATVNLVYGGLSASFSSASTYVDVFKPVTATLSTIPSSPEENHDFSLSVTLTNTASVPVTGVTYTFTIPSGVTVVSGAQISGRTVTVSLPSLGADSNQTVAVTLEASTGLTLDTTPSHLSFQYQGVSLNGLAPKQSITVA